MIDSAHQTLELMVHKLSEAMYAAQQAQPHEHQQPPQETYDDGEIIDAEAV